MSGVRHWSRLSIAAVDASSLEVFKARLDGSSSSMGWLEVSLPVEGGLEMDGL